MLIILQILNFRAVLKQSKQPKYYGQDYLKNFHLHFRSLVMIQISKRSPILDKKEKFIAKTHTNQS